MRFDDIDPDTGRPYPGYSSPSLDTSFHDQEMAVEDPFEKFADEGLEAAAESHAEAETQEGRQAATALYNHMEAVRALGDVTSKQLRKSILALLRSEWLLFNTLPFVNAEAVESVIRETETIAIESGMAAGVFNSNSLAEA